MDRRRRDKSEDVIAVVDRYVPVGKRRALRNIGPYVRSEMGEGVYDRTLQSINRNLAGLLELWPETYALQDGNYFVKRLR